MSEAFPEPALTYDGGSLACLDVLAPLETRLAPLPAGSVVAVINDDPAAPLELRAWCLRSRFTYLGEARREGRPAYFLRKNAFPTSGQ